MDCTFNDCNLSLMKLSQTNFQETIFTGCKMLGLRFDQCNQFNLSFTFDRCLLNHSSFYQARIRKTIFRNTQLQEADFTECDLTASVFENCDLAKALFDHTIIEQADFRTSINYSIDPGLNRIKNAKFSLSGVAGLLDKYHIEIDNRS